MNNDAPQFRLKRVYSDGSEEPAGIVPLTRLPHGVQLGRRGFLTLGGWFGAASATLVTAGCEDQGRVVAGKGGVTATSAGQGLAHGNLISGLEFTPDGATLVSASLDDTVKLWSMPAGALAGTFRNEQPGRVLLPPHANGDGTVLDRTPPSVAAPSVTEALPRDPSPISAPSPDQIEAGALSSAGDVYAIALSPDGRALAEVREDIGLRVRLLANGAVVGRNANLNLVGDESRIFCALVAFSRKGSWMATGERYSGLDSVRLWSIGREYELFFPVKVIEGGRDLRCLCFSPDGHLLASGAGGGLSIWSVPDGALKAWRNLATVRSIAFSPDGRWLASGAWDGTIKLWSMPEAKIDATLRPPYESSDIEGDERVTAVAISPDGRWLAAGSPNGKLTLWSLAERTLAATLSPHDRLDGNHVVSVAFSPDSATLACGYSRGRIEVCSIPGFERILSLTDPSATLEPPPPVEQEEAPPPPSASSGGSRSGARACGAGIPAGAVCTCNCVAVCQAHRLDHADPFVRAMAQALTPRVAARDPDYLEWAEYTATPQTAALIRELRSHPHRFNSAAPVNIDRCRAYLWHEDLVVRVMAAQMLSTHPQYFDGLNREDRRHVEAALHLATDLHWRRRTTAPRLTRTLN